MEEKKFSMIVLAFIFMVAIPSIIFIFSNNAGNTANVAMQPYPERIQYEYGGMVESPEYYQNYQDKIRGGKLVPIYGADGLATYTQADVTPSSERSRYNVANSPSALQSGCPAHCVKISSAKSAQARQATTQGLQVFNIDGNFCLCPR